MEEQFDKVILEAHPLDVVLNRIIVFDAIEFDYFFAYQRIRIGLVRL
jgi:hypothetical protein